MIEVREMDDRYILDDCPTHEPFDPRDLPESNRSKRIRRQFFSEVREQYGNCVLFAWDDSKIVGFLMFLPKPVARKLGWPILPEEGPTEKTLVYGCMQMAEAYRGKGVGTKLVEALIGWARDHGWRRIEVNGIGRGDDDEDWRWGWALPKWERMGFKAAREDPLSVVRDLSSDAYP